MVEITINNVSVEYKDGFNITEEYSEALDTGLIILPHMLRQSFEPFDSVVISDSVQGYTKYMLVSSVRETISKFSTPREYNYEIGLVSNTIKLQRIILPNRSITRSIITGSKSIYYYLDHFRQVYASDYVFSQQIIDATQYVSCPEFQWSRPTLYEVFNDLLSVINAVVTVQMPGIIDMMSLVKSGTAINESDFNDIESSRSIEDYADTIEMDASNVVSPQENAITTNWIGLRTTQADGVLTDETAEIIVEKPIQKINRIWFWWGDDPLGIHDITDWVLEKKQYDLLKVSNAVEPWIGEGYKRHYLYYTEGSNVIGGLCYKDSTWFPEANSWGSLYSLAIHFGMTGINIFDIIFKIEYTTVEGVKFASFKSENLNHPGIKLINGQEEAYISLEAAAKKQQNTVNRFGNQTLQIYNKYSSVVDTIPNLADSYENDYILVKRVLSFYPTYIGFTGMLSKNYVKRNLFTGLNSKKRYTQLLPDNEAFVSNHLNSITMEFGFENETNIGSLENYFLQFGKNYKNIEIAAIRTKFIDDSYSVDIGLAGSAFVADKSIIYNIKMYDNYTAGLDATEQTTILGVPSARIMGYVPYVDNNGEFKSIDIELYTQFDNPGVGSSTPSLWNSALERIKKYPEIDKTKASGFVFGAWDILRYKDNREITAETFQFSVRNTESIFLGHSFFADNPFVYKGLTKTLHLKYTFSENQYNELSDFGVGASGDGLFNIVISQNFIEIQPMEDNGVDETRIKSWGVVDGNNNLYVGVNSNTLKIYLNVYSLYEFDDISGYALPISITGGVSVEGGRQYSWQGPVDETQILSSIEISGGKQYEWNGSVSVDSTCEINITGYIEFAFAGYAIPEVSTVTIETDYEPYSNLGGQVFVNSTGQIEIIGVKTDIGGEVSVSGTVEVIVTGGKQENWQGTASVSILYDNTELVGVVTSKGGSLSIPSSATITTSGVKQRSSGLDYIINYVANITPSATLFDWYYLGTDWPETPDGSGLTLPAASQTWLTKVFMVENGDYQYYLGVQK